ncbi:hypothetical protein EJ04DRAFT_578138 [Polyplosphaeria fusca]|uniref:C2H2-type domain-containing protein n=1 Tax=Polyplosphaeria fusca TaxID=682080 RepID=A0A9P4QRX9_9PLEO|nr:hypothetical protein EJ04DRAFT_578138 [Polyplosphaeria fusca]
MNSRTTLSELPAETVHIAAMAEFELNRREDGIQSHLSSSEDDLGTRYALEALATNLGRPLQLGATLPREADIPHPRACFACGNTLDRRNSDRVDYNSVGFGALSKVQNDPIVPSAMGGFANGDVSGLNAANSTLGPSYGSPFNLTNAGSIVLAWPLREASPAVGWMDSTASQMTHAVGGYLGNEGQIGLDAFIPAFDTSDELLTNAGVVEAAPSNWGDLTDLVILDASVGDDTFTAGLDYAELGNTLDDFNVFNPFDEVANSRVGLPTINQNSATPLPISPLSTPSSSTPTRTPVPCTYPSCHATFARLPDLDRHIMGKHSVGPKRYPCPGFSCTKAFARSDKLRDHLKQGHKLDANAIDQVVPRKR